MNGSSLYFIVYFSKQYSVQAGIAIQSFLRHHKQSKGYVICLDSESFNYMKLKNFGQAIKLFKLNELQIAEYFYNKLQTDRSVSEAVFSMKPILIEEILNQIPEEGHLVYFDVDIYFYESLLDTNLFSNKWEVMLSKHLLSNDSNINYEYGRFNAGFLIFRNSVPSREILRIWKELCIDWCRLEMSKGRFADQKYLDIFENFKGVTTLINPGINNRLSYFKSKKVVTFNKLENVVKIDGATLICFHFHGFRIYRDYLETGFNRYGWVHNRTRLLQRIYMPYINEVKDELKEIGKLSIDIGFLGNSAKNSFIRTLIKRFKFSVVKLPR